MRAGARPGSASRKSRRWLRPAQVCVFYLVLRGLDTVEDDMSIPEARKFVAFCW
jgi:phytoene/squalene synthetase